MKRGREKVCCDLASAVTFFQHRADFRSVFSAFQFSNSITFVASLVGNWHALSTQKKPVASFFDVNVLVNGSTAPVVPRMILYRLIHRVRGMEEFVKFEQGEQRKGASPESHPNLFLNCPADFFGPRL
jgi:hypothetical protein